MIDSITNVLATMATMEVSAGEISLKKGPEAMGDVSAIIMMHGQKLSGSMAVSFKKKVILDVAERMLGERVEEIDESIIDLVGEITNMACGGAKAQLAKKGYEIVMATPVVVMGQNHQIIHQARGPKIILPLRVDSGEFYIELCFDIPDTESAKQN